MLLQQKGWRSGGGRRGGGGFAGCGSEGKQGSAAVLVRSTVSGLGQGEMRADVYYESTLSLIAKR